MNEIDTACLINKMIEIDTACNDLWPNKDHIIAPISRDLHTHILQAEVPINCS